MPQLRRHFKGYQLPDTSISDESQPVFTIPAGKSVMTQAFEVKGQEDKTLWILSNAALALELYIAPERSSQQGDYLLYKTNEAVAANVPYIFHSSHVMPFLSIKLTNNTGGPATVKGWLFAQ